MTYLSRSVLAQPRQPTGKLSSTFSFLPSFRTYRRDFHTILHKAREDTYGCRYMPARFHLPAIAARPYNSRARSLFRLTQSAVNSRAPRSFMPCNWKVRAQLLFPSQLPKFILPRLALFLHCSKNAHFFHIFSTSALTRRFAFATFHAQFGRKSVTAIPPEGRTD